LVIFFSYIFATELKSQRYQTLKINLVKVMKKVISFILVIMCLGSIHARLALDNPRILQMDLTAAELAHYMVPGWNLGNTMEACNSNFNFTNKGGLWNENSWQSAKTTQSFITLLKEKGFKSIRIPCGWVAGHLTNSQDMTIDAQWMARVKEIISYCLNANLYVVINDHWDGGWLEYDGFTDQVNVDEKKKQLAKLWTNIALELKEYDERVIFAGLNEPGVGGKSPQAVGTKLDEKTQVFANRLLEYEQEFIDAVRATGGNNAHRVLVVQTPTTNIDIACSGTFDVTKLKDSAKDRLMVEVHFYDPYTFTMMGKDESWGKVNLYWNGHAPSNTGDRTCNTIGYNNQNVNADTYIRNMMDKMKTNFVNQGYPVIIGEFGSNHRDVSNFSGRQDKHEESLQYWYNWVVSSALKAGLVPFVWDTNYQGFPRMTVFNRANPAVSDTYIYKGIMEGVENGKSAFERIYPRPSEVSTGIKEVSENGKSRHIRFSLYTLDGRLVNSGREKHSTKELPSGVYVLNGRKYVVK